MSNIRPQRRWTVVDTIANNAFTGTADEIRDELRSWFPQADDYLPDIDRAIDVVHRGLLNHQPIDSACVYLAIRVEDYR